MFVEVLFGTLGGAVVALAAVRFLSKSLVGHRLAKDLKAFELNLRQTLDTEVERVKGAISYHTSLSVQRIDHLRALWQATHVYGGAVACVAKGEGAKDDVNRRIEAFKEALSKAGIFLGHERFERLFLTAGS